MLVTGATGSIGGAVAAAAIAAGWQVVVHGRSGEAVERLAARLGPDATGIAATLGETPAVARLVGEAGAWRGRIDAVVDCVSMGPSPAAGRVLGTLAETDPAAYAGFATASLVHVQQLAHAALPWLAQRGGTFVAFASDAGRFAAPRQTLVGASRGGIIAFVRNLAVEVARDGVRVHCISPSFVAASRSFARASPERAAKAQARAGLGLPTPEDIAPAVLFLAGDGARRITGQVIGINGGLNA